MGLYVHCWWGLKEKTIEQSWRRDREKLLLSRPTHLVFVSRLVCGGYWLWSVEVIDFLIVATVWFLLSDLSISLSVPHSSFSSVSLALCLSISLYFLSFFSHNISHHRIRSPLSPTQPSPLTFPPWQSLRDIPPLLSVDSSWKLLVRCQNVMEIFHNSSYTSHTSYVSP